ncbi:hypothetical protein HUK38_02800 [Thiospirillum jenense]|uniref:Secreted protein n=2 Tax=Thiospirillum jenense TaxID=1653858 RepID=A0A839HDR8_9GAMM|nr:hypothetical protein [Thiospirillum jenense]
MFCKQRGLIYCAIAALGLVTNSVFAETDGFIPETPAMIKKIKAWEACAERVTAREVKICQKAGYTVCIGSSGRIDEVFTECGYKPSSQLTKKQIEEIDSNCQSASSICEYKCSFWDYGDDSTVWKLASKRCARVYAANAGKRAQEEKERQERLKKEEEQALKKAEAARQAKALERAKPFSIERSYQITDNYVGVIIRTDRARFIKCALVNADDDYLRVDTEIVTPPVDEMTIRSDGVNWTAVKCWATELK